MFSYLYIWGKNVQLKKVKYAILYIIKLVWLAYQTRQKNDYCYMYSYITQYQ